MKYLFYCLRFMRVLLYFIRCRVLSRFVYCENAIMYLYMHGDLFSPAESGRDFVYCVCTTNCPWASTYVGMMCGISRVVREWW